MEFELEKGLGIYQIQSYSNECIVINGEAYNHSVIVMPEQIITCWGPETFESLLPEHFQTILNLKPQIVLLGTGLRLQFPSAHIYSVLTNQKIGVEVMDTSAACRTYQVLMAEGRRVAAALISR